MKLLLFFFFFGCPYYNETQRSNKKNKWLSAVVGIAIIFFGSIITGSTFYALNYFNHPKTQCCQDTVNVRVVNEHSLIKDIGENAVKELLKTGAEKGVDKIMAKENQDSITSLKPENKFKTHTK